MQEMEHMDMGGMNGMDSMAGHDMGGMGMEGGMDMGGMMMDMGPVVFGGIHLVNLLLMISGVFYLICAISIFKTWRREKNELVGALFAFLCYQAVSMFFMGLEMQTMNMLYSNIAALAIFVGSAYMLKFPLSKLSEKVRRGLFLLILVILLALFVWFIQTPDRQMDLTMFTMWYDLVVNGIVVGGSIILFGMRAVEKTFRRKAIGGGTGVVSCCVIATGAMLGGALLTGTIFSFLAPIIILSTLRQGKGQVVSSSNPTPASAAPVASM
jgi:peptidoglycan/LPS O-acetylase OafA/YrhL